jgi:hypothetical protein
MIPFFMVGTMFLFMLLICSASGIGIWEGKAVMAVQEKDSMMQVAILHQQKCKLGQEF